MHISNFHSIFASFDSVMSFINLYEESFKFKSTGYTNAFSPRTEILTLSNLLNKLQKEYPLQIMIFFFNSIM